VKRQACPPDGAVRQVCWNPAAGKPTAVFMPALQSLAEGVSWEVAVPEDLRGDSRSQDFTGVGGGHSRAAVGVAHEMVAAPHPGHLETNSCMRRDHADAGEARQARRDANRTRCTPTRPSESPVSLRLAHFFGTSAQSWLNLQNLYELRRAEEKVGIAIKRLPTLERGEQKHA